MNFARPVIKNIALALHGILILSYIHISIRYCFIIMLYLCVKAGKLIITFKIISFAPK